MSKTFIASRLTSGNRIFPTQVTIADSSVTMRIPSILSGKERTIPFNRISSVNIDCPTVGFSTIFIETTGEGKIEAHGFFQEEVKEMKQLILSKIND